MRGKPGERAIPPGIAARLRFGQRAGRQPPALQKSLGEFRRGQGKRRIDELLLTAWLPEKLRHQT